MSGEPLLAVSNLGVAFRQGGTTTMAVEGASFDIAKGETMALVGESGSGKSVTALSVMRLLPGSAVHPAGAIHFKGKDLLTADDKELRAVRGGEIGIIFQEPMTSLNPLHTIERQVSEVMKVHRGLSETAARAHTLELLEQVGIRDAESRLCAYPHQLSGGQRQRVMIAMALANEPDLLIADEPTTALDVTVQAQILKLLADLQKQTGMAMLFITHDLGIVRRFASKVCVMTGGHIVEQGRTEDIFTNPQHAYTRHLLAAEPKGDPPKPDAGAPVVMEADKLKVWFPIRRGFLRKTVGHIKAVDGIDVTVRRGQTLGVVGESGSGKTTLGLALMRLISSEGRIAFLGQGIDGRNFKQMRPLRRAMQIVFQDPYGSLSPRMSIGDIVGEGLKVHEPTAFAGRARQARGRGAGGSRARCGDAQPLPARILRRPAPAHRGRPRHGAGAGLRHARRADLGARHERAGAGGRPAARAAAAARPRLSVHQPRPQGRAGARQRHHGDAQRRGGRTGPCGARVRQSQDRLYAGADGRRLRHRDGAGRRGGAE